MAVSSTSRYPLVIEPLAGKFPIKYGSFIAGKIIENHGECSIATFDEQMVFLGSYGGGQQFQHSAKIMRKIHFLVLKILMKIQLPSGKRPNIAMERSTMLLMGKSTFSMAMFNSFLYVHQRASHLCRSASEHPFLDRKKPHFGSDLSGVPSWELMPSWWVSLSIPMHRRCAPCVENFQPLFDYWSHWVYVNTC